MAFFSFYNLIELYFKDYKLLLLINTIWELQYQNEFPLKKIIFL